MHPAAALAICLCLVSGAPAQQLRLHHRLVSPDGRPTPFSERASLRYNTDAGLATGSSAVAVTQAPSLEDDLRQYLERAAREPGLLYQLALEREHDTGEDQWAVSSVKACHLRTSTADVVRLHVDARTRTPYSLDYFLVPVPHNGACPPASAASSKAPLTNTTVTVHSSFPAPAPQLRTPPPLSAQGEAIKPEQEKSFLQKYWLYILGFILIQLLMTSPPEEGKEGGEGAGAPAPAK